MNLHEHKEDFEELIVIVADFIGIPAVAVRRDYYIVQMMQNLQNSEYAEACVFKGGTSLSKCYPGSINRFSEEYDPMGAYVFENWKQYFNAEICGRYETLHEDLLYTSDRQSFKKAVQAFEFISKQFSSIGE